MKFDIYFIRHGETTANRDYILQGHCDYPLTDLGINQSLAVGNDLNSIKWHKVYSSDLPRAVHTTNLLLSRSTVGEDKHSLTLSENVREIAYGVREGLSRSLSASDAKVEYARINNMAVENVVDTAENTESVLNRQKEFILQVLLDYLAEQTNNDDHNHSNGHSSTTTNSNGNGNTPILCVSHGGYIKLFLRTYCKLAKVEKIDNCSVSVVTIEWKDILKPLKFECTASLDRVNRSPSHIV